MRRRHLIEAKVELKRLHNELMLINRSAAASFEEGLEETLMHHRQNSSQKPRWVMTALLEVETRLRKKKDHR